MSESSSREDFDRRQAEAAYQAKLKSDDATARRERSMSAADNPDSAEAMDKHFAKQDEDRAREVSDYRSSQQRAAYIKSQRDYFESVSEGMSAQGIIDRGGVQLADTQTIGGGAAAIVAAGGERKGTRQTIESGAAGIIAAGGQKTGFQLGIGASFRDQYNAVRWGSGMQAYRTLGRQYQKAQREKKKNDGGLTAARQPYGAMNFISNRPMFRVGAVTFVPMRFDGATPIVGTFSAGENGWPHSDFGESDVMKRMARMSGRNRWNQYTAGPQAPLSNSNQF